MGNGYSQGSGTDLLWCSTPRPETPQSENDSPNFVAGRPNVNHGNFDYRSSLIMESRITSNNDTHSFDNVDVNDFTLEFWIRRLFPDSITNWQTSAAAATGYCISGTVAEQSPFGTSRPIAGTSGAARGDAAGIQVRGANFEAFYQEIGTTFVSRTFTLGFGWHHVCITYDRSGNMETFVDGTSFGTNAINANSLTFTDFCAMYCNITDQATASGKAEAPYVLAGMAAHEILLTDAQIANSVRNVSLQALGANTYFSFFYDSIILRRSAWTTVSGFTPTTQAETLGIFSSSIRSELSTIIADARMQIVEVTAANTDLDNGGLAGAVQLPDKSATDNDEEVQPYSQCTNLNIGGTVGSVEHIGIGPGLGGFESGTDYA